MRGKVMTDQIVGCIPDHPRVCGEKVSYCHKMTGYTGSPPRMRGKAIFGLVAAIAAGITPAYAGKSRLLLRRLVCPEDHPRVCGEKKSK